MVSVRRRWLSINETFEVRISATMAAISDVGNSVDAGHLGHDQYRPEGRLGDADVAGDHERG